MNLRRLLDESAAVLVKRYDNKRIIISSLLEKLMTVANHES